ncbi:MAG: PQQ-binding-like beta-propeller repeat protein, partial [Phycisphaerae bacterium]
MPPSFSRNTLFSVRKYSMTSCCCRFIQPATATTMNCQGVKVMARMVVASSRLGNQVKIRSKAKSVGLDDFSRLRRHHRVVILAVHLRGANRNVQMSVSMAKVGWRLAALFLAAGLAYQSRAKAAEIAEGQAKAILDSSGVSGGLVVHVGCGDGRLTAALRANPRLVVHGLDSDVKEARRTIRSAGLYGPVSAEHWGGGRLPYVDNLVRLLVVTGDSQRISRNERLRVLCPGGVAMVAGSKIVKPWPDEIDEWTHYLHGPGNNAVADDKVVGPPHHFQWIGGPRFSRSHDHLASVSAVVSAGGRIFYIADFGSIGYAGSRGRWRLIARDAFNGVQLWEREIAPWENHLRDFRSGPADIARRLVAVGPSAGSGQSGRVYVTLGYGKPVTALDAATGEALRTYSETKGAREILHYEGTLLLALGEPDENWRAEEAQQIVTQKDYLPPFKTVTPPGHNMKVMAVDASTGRVLWNNAEPYTRGMMPSTLAAAGGRVYFHNPDAVVCLDATTGKKVWEAPRPVQRKRLAWSVPTLVAHDGIVYSGDRMAAEKDGEVLWIPSGGYHEYIRGPEAKGELIAFDGKTGKRLWSCPAYEGFNSPVDVLIADGLLWTGRYAWGQDPGVTEGRDPRTGEVRRRRPADQKLLARRIGHARCHRAKATSQYLVLGRRGLEFVDVKTGEMVANFWVRGICQYGVMPANGLLYVPPHSCACSVTDMLKCGFTALAPASKQSPGAKPAASNRLVRGPAYGTAPAALAAAAKDAWPTYRHDAARSGVTASPISRDLKVAW